MFYIDESIINSSELMNRLEWSVSEKEIDSSFFSQKECNGCRIDINHSLEKLKLLSDRLESLYTVHEVPITSHRKHLGKYIVFSKKVFRKLTRWFVHPYINQQNSINQLVVKLIREIVEVEKILISTIEQEKK